MPDTNKNTFICAISNDEHLNHNGIPDIAIKSRVADQINQQHADWQQN